MPKRCLIFVHYKTDGGISANALRLLRWYRQHVSKLILVSNSPLGEAAWQQLLSFCDEVIERENTGYDFGAWRSAIEAFQPFDGYDELVLANDSVLGPVATAEDLFDRVSALPQDVCGLVASWEYGWHLQSWFICYKRSAFAAPAFRAFWQRVEPQAGKVELISNYEVGLTQALMEGGLSFGALYTASRSPSVLKRIAIAARNISPFEPGRSVDCLKLLRHLPELNPTHFEWDAIIAAGVPFIKQELVERNPNCLDTKRVFRRLQTAQPERIDLAS